MNSADTAQALPISEYAIVVDPSDNVAVVKRETHPGLELALAGGRIIRISDIVPPGHRFATRAIPEGEFVLQYGQPIGTSLGIGEGDYVSHANLSNEVPLVRDLPEGLHTSRPNYVPELDRARSWVFADRWTRGNPELRAPRADKHVREPRGDADRYAGGVHALVARPLSKRRRRRRDPAQQRLWGVRTDPTWT
jgi:hypothetical protein